jgi:large subunit ribosomal protein L10
MPRPDKVAEVEELKGRFAQGSVVLVDYRGLSAPECVELRRMLRKERAEFRVVKNTLARLAAGEAGAEPLVEYLQGPNALVVGYDDPLVAFRAAWKCARRFSLRIKAGLFEGSAVPPEEVEWYANLPSREELLAQLAGAMNGPIRGLYWALTGIIRGLVVALAEVHKKEAA